MNKQNFISIDLELNQPSNKIIQVGVAIGNSKQNPKDYTVQKWYVDPKEPIDNFITNLTGITESDIRANCVSLDTVALELTALIKTHEPWLQAVVWGYNDIEKLRRVFEKNNVVFNHLGGRWIDVKTIYNFLMFSQDKSPKGSLDEAMAKSECWFEGEKHRADIDACNTLKFWFDLMRKQNSMFDLLTKKQYNNE